MKVCAIDGCERHARARSWCTRHYRAWHLYGDPLVRVKVRKTCSVEGCFKPAHGQGLCRMHWRRRRETGDAQERKPNRMERRVDGMKLCPSCDRELSIDQFNRNDRRKDGRAGWCKSCAGSASHSWRDGHRAASGASTARRRESERDNGGKYTAADVAAQYLRQHGSCYWCGVKVGKAYHVDHVFPLSRGGSNGPDNLVVACPACNCAKGAKLPHEFAGRLC